MRTTVSVLLAEFLYDAELNASQDAEMKAKGEAFRSSNRSSIEVRVAVRANHLKTKLELNICR